MSSKDGLCLWCGRWTESRAEDGLADCDRPECIENRDYDDSDMGSGPITPKTITTEGTN